MVIELWCSKTWPLVAGLPANNTETSLTDLFVLFDNAVLTAHFIRYVVIRGSDPSGRAV
jgi:hypothetical protein